MVRGKGPPRRDSRRGGARLYSLPQRVQGFQVSRRDGEIRLYGKVRNPRYSEMRYHLVERGRNGKVSGALSRSIRQSGCCSFPFPLPPSQLRIVLGRIIVDPKNTKAFSPLPVWKMSITMDTRLLMHSSLPCRPLHRPFSHIK